VAGPFALLGVPTSAGTHGPGQEKAPGALRAAGLVRALEAAGVEVEDEGDLPVAMYRAAVADPRQRDLDGVADVAGRVAGRVAEVLDRKMTPLVLGGDCTITLGVVAGFAGHGDDLGLLYFDGDADLSIPATTSSGVLDSMVVAHLLGEGAPALARLGPRSPLLPADRLVLFGFDDPDDFGRPSRRSWPGTARRPGRPPGSGRPPADRGRRRPPPWATWRPGRGRWSSTSTSTRSTAATSRWPTSPTSTRG